MKAQNIKGKSLMGNRKTSAFTADRIEGKRKINMTPSIWHGQWVRPRLGEHGDGFWIPWASGSGELQGEGTGARDLGDLELSNHQTLCGLWGKRSPRELRTKVAKDRPLGNHKWPCGRRSQGGGKPQPPPEPSGQSLRGGGPDAKGSWERLGKWTWGHRYPSQKAGHKGKWEHAEVWKETHSEE